MCSNSYLNHYIKVGQLPKCMVSCVESTGQLLMKRVVSSSEICTERTQNILKQVMLISEENNTEISIYGKTGMGKAEGIVVDAWFTGFAETLEGNKYFCVYLGQSDAGNTSSTAAKEIAIQILNDNK